MNKKKKTGGGWGGGGGNVGRWIKDEDYEATKYLFFSLFMLLLFLFK